MAPMSDFRLFSSFLTVILGELLCFSTALIIQTYLQLTGITIISFLQKLEIKPG